MNISTRFLTVTIFSIANLTSALAQTRSVRDTATAYGARVNAKGQPANLNQFRVNSRIQNRIDNRLALRIERYRPEGTAEPAAAYKAQSSRTDKVRATPIASSLSKQGDTD